MALDALESYTINEDSGRCCCCSGFQCANNCKANIATLTLRAALALPDAEPVAYKVGCLLTVNDDQYPALPGLFGQLWDGEVVAARVYGNSREEVNARVAALNVNPSAPMERKPLALTDLNDLAKVYGIHYASPHHMTFTVEGLRNLIEASHNIK